MHPTVAEDVAFGLENQGVPAGERAERVAEVLDRYGLAGHADHPAHLLSGGQKQLLAIAGVLVMRPARIVFDEPTTLLDLVNTRRVARVIEELEQQVVVVTHDLDLLDGLRPGAGVRRRPGGRGRPAGAVGARLPGADGRPVTLVAVRARRRRAVVHRTPAG